MVMKKPSLPTKASRAATALRVKITREALGLKPVDICRATGITASQYSNYESGVSRPNIEDAIRYSEVLGISLDWLYKGDPSKLPLDIANRVREIALRAKSEDVI